MTDRESLMRAICAAPHDDLPRLVFADWLQESGADADAAFAEFIRIQCDMAKATCQHPAAQWCDCDPCRWARRVVELFDRWMGLFPACCGIGRMPIDYQFLKNAELGALTHWRRGFPWRVRAVIDYPRIHAIPTQVCRLFEAFPVTEVNVELVRPPRTRNLWMHVWVQQNESSQLGPVCGMLSYMRMSSLGGLPHGVPFVETVRPLKDHAEIPMRVRGCVRELLSRRHELNDQTRTPDPRPALPDPRTYIRGTA